MKKKNEQSMSEALKEFSSQLKFKDNLLEAQIQVLWPELFGQTIAKYTEKLSIKGSTLTIHVSSAPLRQELFYAKETILSQIKDRVGDQVITKIELK